MLLNGPLTTSEFDVLDVDSEAEALFELGEQLHHLERVQNAALEQIGVRGGHLDVKALDEHGAQALDDGVCVGQFASFRLASCNAPTSAGGGGSSCPIPGCALRKP